MDKYTIDAISNQLGYKSPSTFREIFKEITSVSPSSYIKQIKEKQMVSLHN
jgi:AraC-like DNA-binding protein